MISQHDHSFENKEPFLSRDVFQCSEERSCTTSVINAKSNVQYIDSGPDIIMLHKTKGLYLAASLLIVSL